MARFNSINKYNPQNEKLFKEYVQQNRNTLKYYKKELQKHFPNDIVYLILQYTTPKDYKYIKSL